MFSRLMCKTLHLHSNTGGCFMHAYFEGFKGKYVHAFLFLLNNNDPVKKKKPPVVTKILIGFFCKTIF